MLPGQILGVDFLIAAGALTVGGGVLFLASRLSGVSPVPSLLLLPVFTVIGGLLYTPQSPAFIASDGDFYRSWGYSIALSWSNGTEPLVGTLWPGKGFWPLIIGLLTSVFGPVSLVLVVFNSVTLAGAIVVLQRTILLLGGRDARAELIVVVLTSPALLIFGPSTLREAIFWFGLSLGGLGIALVARRTYFSASVSMSASTFLLAAIRPDAGLVLGYSLVIVALVLFFVQVKPKRSLKGLFALAIVCVIAASFPPVFDAVRPGVDAGFIDNAGAELSSASVTTAFGPVRSEADADSLSICDESVGGSVLCNAIVGLPNAFFGPFFWEIGPEPVWLVSAASTMHFVCLLALALVPAIYRRSLRKPAFMYMVVAAASMVMFASILTNYGILIRFRAATEIILIPLAILGVQLISDWIRPSGRVRSASNRKSSR